MSDLDETFTEASERYFDTIYQFIEYLHVLKDSRKRLGGQEES